MRQSEGELRKQRLVSEKDEQDRGQTDRQTDTAFSNTYCVQSSFLAAYEFFEFSICSSWGQQKCNHAEVTKVYLYLGRHIVFVRSSEAAKGIKNSPLDLKTLKQQTACLREVYSTPSASAAFL